MDHQIIIDMLSRSTTKKYDSTKKITQMDLNVLFESMRLSPSSINSQPWRFVVIESEKAKKRMSKTFVNKFQFNQPHVFDSSHIILFAYNPRYTRDDYAKVVDKQIVDGRTKSQDRENAFGAFMFVDLNTDENGDNSRWTKAQTYIAFGNTLHTLARLKIDSTPLEGIDIDLVNEEFKNELSGYQCDVALAIGYRHQENDYNSRLPKSRLSLDSVLVTI
ncbi:NAD(P)H-dependent oxidoreductase [Francisella halioticida]|uniref:NAD(P)H-dependent oxidoreductase n=1 Tax=Francisella halioticida TaxID=549298 RepID=A0ABN5B2X5_9GAMM|nr:nitroreductase family protein [Francisella halioticida]ASG68943.1 NAD(P)H-dependent oxidoreductase [Francisella halioticida]